MRIHGGLRLARLALPGAAAAALLSLLLQACASLGLGPAEGEPMLRGHDPVAYFTAGKPVAGDPALRAEHRGLAYRFASEDNRRLFITSPERFVPQFGGLCAEHMAYALPVEGDPAVFKVVDGRLYLFEDARARAYFEMDQEINLRRAAQYWDAEVRDANRTLQYVKRMLWRVPHYKSEGELADEYARRFGRPPG